LPAGWVPAGYRLGTLPIHHIPIFSTGWVPAGYRLGTGWVLSVLHCTALYCTVLYSTVLYCTVLYCTVLYCAVLYCTAVHCTALHCTALHCTALHFTVMCKEEATITMDYHFAGRLETYPPGSQTVPCACSCFGSACSCDDSACDYAPCNNRPCNDQNGFEHSQCVGDDTTPFRCQQNSQFGGVCDYNAHDYTMCPTQGTPTEWYQAGYNLYMYM
jgi:hypothetical protein